MRNTWAGPNNGMANFFNFSWIVNFEPKVRHKLTPIARKKSFLKLVNLNQIWIVITIFRLIWYQTEFRFVPNQSEYCNYYLNLFWINKIPKIFLRMHNVGLNSRDPGSILVRDISRYIIQNIGISRFVFFID